MKDLLLGSSRRNTGHWEETKASQHLCVEPHTDNSYLTFLYLDTWIENHTILRASIKSGSTNRVENDRVQGPGRSLENKITGRNAAKSKFTDSSRDWTRFLSQLIVALDK